MALAFRLQNDLLETLTEDSLWPAASGTTRVPCERLAGMVLTLRDSVIRVIATIRISLATVRIPITKACCRSTSRTKE